MFSTFVNFLSRVLVIAYAMGVRVTGAAATSYTHGAFLILA